MNEELRIQPYWSLYFADMKAFHSLQLLAKQRPVIRLTEVQGHHFLCHGRDKAWCRHQVLHRAKQQQWQMSLLKRSPVCDSQN